MKCTEVGELMQRHLDYDLNESELEVLMTHLSECDQCTELYEKLTLLSGSLEQLPRVTPSISIVDSILPELEKIDFAKENEKKIALIRRKRIWTALTSVATAAAIVVLMVNLNGNPVNNSSDVAMESSLDSSAVNSNHSNNSSSEDKASEKRSAVTSSDEKLFITPYNLVPTSSKTNKGDVKQESDLSDQESSSIMSTPSTNNDFTPITEGPIPTGKSNTSENLEIIPQSDTQTQRNDQLLGITGTPVEDPEESQSILLNDENKQYFSLDGKFYLKFESHTIAVYETSSNELIQEWTKPIEGSYEFLSWDEDGSSFSFQATDETGNVTQYLWVIGQEEVKE